MTSRSVISNVLHFLAAILTAIVSRYASNKSNGVQAFTIASITQHSRSLKHYSGTSTYSLITSTRNNITRQIWVRSSSSPTEETFRQDEETEMTDLLPWGEFQEWALRDNLPKYLITIPQLPNGGGPDGRTYALWRSMLQDVTEFAGYDVAFVRRKHQNLIDGDASFLRDNEDGVSKDSNDRNNKDTSNQQTINSIKSNAKLIKSPGILPLLDQFTFDSNGGVTGSAYGIPGIADGTSIQTSVLVDVQETVPRGFVRTKDGIVGYELGIPASDFYSLDGSMGSLTVQKRKEVLIGIATGLSLVAKDARDVVAVTTKNVSVNDEDTEKFLINVGTSTGILLAAGVAMNLLSHHLTVNVFWV